MLSSIRHPAPLAMFAALAAAALALLPARAGAQGCESHHDHDTREDRERAHRKVAWKHPFHVPERVQKVRLLGFNDFHGNLSAGRFVAGQPVGGAAVLAAYLKAAGDSAEGPTYIVHGGDHVGASPPVSALLQDEPAISFLNLLANRHCSDRNPEHLLCNVVGTLGNHEFDEGRAELLRLIGGGNHPAGPFLEPKWRGARFPYICANVVEKRTGETLLPPVSIKLAGGVPVAFIGAVLKETPTIVTPTGVAGLDFLDEAEAINRHSRRLARMGIHAQVVLIHQGGTQPSYTGPTRPDAAPVAGGILPIIQKLSSEIDVVVSGHSHAFTNALLKNAEGKEILVTQAFSAGTAFGQIDLDLDRKTRDVTAMSGDIITTWANQGVGLAPDPAVAALVAKAEAAVAPRINREVGTAAGDILMAQNAAGESALGNLIADAQRASVDADFAFMNPGGIRADLNAGTITWGDLFTIQPFGNDVVKMTLTGAQVKALLNQQWVGQPFPRILQVSGLAYTWDSARPVGDRVVEVRRGGVLLGEADVYTVAVNSFIAAGGDNFLVLRDGTDRTVGPVDLDALVDYVSTRVQPLSALIEGRIVRL